MCRCLRLGVPQVGRDTHWDYDGGLPHVRNVPGAGAIVLQCSRTCMAADQLVDVGAHEHGGVIGDVNTAVSGALVESDANAKQDIAQLDVECSRVVFADIEATHISTTTTLELTLTLSYS